MSVQIQLRRGTAGEWTTANPILAHGEVGIEMGDPPSLKVGDGVTAWADLPYSASDGGGGGDMMKADNLSGLADYTAARSNLGLDSAATTASTAYATAAQGATADAALPKVAAGASVENVGAIESNVNTVATSGATETLDTSLYGVHDVTMDQACTFTFSNPAPSGKCTIFTLILRGAFTPTWPAAVDWPDATPPTHTTPAMYVFTTVDAGTTWLGNQAGAGYA